MIINNETPLIEEIRYFAIIGVPSVLLAWLVAWAIQTISPERHNPVLARGYAVLQRWVFFGKQPLGEYESAARAARFRFAVRLFRYFPLALLGLWAGRIAIRLAKGVW